MPLEQGVSFCVGVAKNVGFKKKTCDEICETEGTQKTISVVNFKRLAVADAEMEQSTHTTECRVVGSCSFS